MARVNFGTGVGMREVRRAMQQAHKVSGIMAELEAVSGGDIAIVTVVNHKSSKTSCGFRQATKRTARNIT